MTITQKQASEFIEEKTVKKREKREKIMQIT